MAGEWPLVGRQYELRHLVATAISGKSNGIVLAGPAGVGKTRLAAECLAEVDRAGLPTARVAATRAAAELPFGPLAPLLPAGGGSADRADFLRRCCAALLERAAGRRLVLFVDDAHLLDDASAVLVHQLARTGACFVLMTLRTAEPVPESVGALWKDGLLDRVDLGGLDAEAIAGLVGTVLGGPVETATVARLSARCQGNVLFLRELVIGARSAGTLSRDGGVWHLTGPLSPSDRLVELVEVRLGGLGDAERSLLELVALGEPLGAAELATLADERLAESLERQGLLHSRLDGRRLELTLGHPIYGDVLRAGAAAVRLRATYRRLAGAVEATGARRREDALRVATWGLESGAEVRPDLMLVGAVTARMRWDLPLAERLARVAAVTGAGFDAGLLMGQIQWLRGQSEEAESTLSRLVSSVKADAERTMLATVRMDNLVLGLNRSDDAVRAGEEAEAAVADPALRDEIVARRAYALIMSGRTRQAVRLIEPLVARAKGRTLAAVALSAGHGLALAGRSDDALAAADLGLAAHRDLAGVPLTMGAHGHEAMRCLALTVAGRLVEAEQLGRAEYDRAVSVGSVGAQALFALFLAKGLSRRVWACEALRARGWADAAAGDVTGACRALEEAATVAGESGELSGEVNALHDLVRLGQATGSVCARLAELTIEIDGDFAAACAAHAAALAASDAPGLEQVSARFETMGADLAGAEAAAQAAVMWRGAEDGRRAAAAGRRAALLAARCEGAATPALSALTARSALTPGERDVALLAAAGRTNAAIAAELHLSRRTVENYLYRAYEKLGISARDELASALES